jgi:hypothetical protein
MRILGLLCVLFIALGIAGLILRMACALYNLMAGGRKSPNGVPEPSMARAMAIMFLTLLAQGLVRVLAGFLFAGARGAVIGHDAQLQDRVFGREAVGGQGLLPSLLSFPGGLLVMALLLMLLLPTTFIRALLVAVLEYVVLIVIGAIIFFALTLIYTAKGV